MKPRNQNLTVPFLNQSIHNSEEVKLSSTSSNIHETQKENPTLSNTPPQGEENKNQKDDNNIDPLNFVSVFLKSNTFASNFNNNRQIIKENIEVEQRNLMTSQYILCLQEPSQINRLIQRNLDSIEKVKTKERNTRIEKRSKISTFQCSQKKETNLI